MYLKTNGAEFNTKDLFDPMIEQAAITLLVFNSEKFEKYKDLLQPQVFFNELNQKIISAMTQLLEENKEIDYLTILQTDKTIPADKLSTMIASLPEPLWADPLLKGSHLEEYLKILNELKIKRDIYQKVISGQKTEEVLAEVEKLQNQGLAKFLNPKEIAIETMNVLKNRMQNLSGIPFPLPMLNRATNGIQDNQLIVVAARPSVGKSSLLGNIAIAAARQGKRVVFATAEMSSEMVGMRLVSQLIGKNLFYETELNGLDIDKELTGLNISVLQFTAMSELLSKVKEKRSEIDLLIVDYLQVIEPIGKYRSLYERMTNLINELVHLKVKFNLPIVVASQYNRQAENQQPSMADLRESGAIEQAADVIISLWRLQEDPEDSGKKKIRIDLLKNRNGKTFHNTKTNQYTAWFNNQKFEFFEETSQPPF